MNAQEFDEKFSTSKSLQLLSGLSLAIFTSFMGVSWQKALSEVQAVKETPVTVASTMLNHAGETPMMAEPMTEPIAMTEELAPTIALSPVSEAAPMTIAPVAEITDPQILKQLEESLYHQIDRSWTEVPTFSNHLVYRVAVKSNGAISTYEAVNPAAKNYLNQIPLNRLSDSASTDRADTSPESVAKFLVLFTPGGLLEVNPWVSKES